MKIILIAVWNSPEMASCLDKLLSKGFRPEKVILVKLGMKKKLKLLRYYFRRYDTINFLRTIKKALIRRTGFKYESSNNPQRSYSKHSFKKILEISGIETLVVSSLYQTSTIECLKRSSPDLIVATGVGIIKDSLLQIPKIGFLNVHPGMLPKYRGNNPVEWSLLNGDPLGVTIHFMDRGIDTGPVILYQEYAQPPADTLEQLHWDLIEWGQDVLIRAIALISEGNHCSTPQGPGLYWPSFPSGLRPVVRERLAQRNLANREDIEK